MADIDLSIDVNDKELFAALTRAERELKELDTTADKTGKSIDSAFDKAEKSVNEFTSDVKQAERAVASLGKQGAGVDRGLLKSLKGIRSEMRLFNTLPGVFNAVSGGLNKVLDGLDAYNQATNSTAVITRKVEEATEGVVQQYIAERTELDDLVAVVGDENTSREAKLAGIEKLKTQFPQYFSNLTLETAKTGELAINAEAARKGIEDLAKAKLRDQLLTELRTEAVKKEIEARRAQGVADAFEKQGVFANLANLSTFVITQGSALVQKTNAATALSGAKDIETLNKAIDSVFAVTNQVITQTATTTNSGLQGIQLANEAATKAAKEQKKENEALAGSIADIEKQLSKVNTQIKEQTVAGDIDALTPLVERANELEEQLKEANKQLEELRNPKPFDINSISSIDAEVVLGIDPAKALEQNAALQAALLEQRQQADILLLKEKGYTEEQFTELQRQQEKERQKLALETEQARLEFTIKYGEQRAEAETQALNAQLDAVKSQLKGFGIEAQEAVTGGQKGFSVFRALGLDPDTEEGKAAIAAIEKAGNLAIEQFQKLFEAQVQIAEQEVALRDKNLASLQEQLANELKARELGFASNVEATQKEIEEERKAREKALKDQQQARTAQFVLDTALQASSLITASAQIFQSFAALPFGIGIPIAVGVIGAMLGAFVAGKVKVAQSLKFNEGGRLPKVGEGGRSDEGSGAGHRIEGTNLVVGGGEHVINATESERHDKLLANINAGKYKNLDLLEIVEGRNKRTRSTNLTAVSIRQQSNEAIEKQTAIMERYLKHIVKKPQMLSNADGTLTEIHTDLNGNRHIINIKKPKQ